MPGTEQQHQQAQVVVPIETRWHTPLPLNKLELLILYYANVYKLQEDVKKVTLTRGQNPMKSVVAGVVPTFDMYGGCRV